MACSVLAMQFSRYAGALAGRTLDQTFWFYSACAAALAVAPWAFHQSNPEQVFDRHSARMIQTFEHVAISICGWASTFLESTKSAWIAVPIERLVKLQLFERATTIDPVNRNAEK
jgi:hypothetical protein